MPKRRSAYTLDRFNEDMKQLGGMIEDFYKQNGGDCCGQDGGASLPNVSEHKVGDVFKHDGKKYKVVKKKDGSKKWHHERHYKIISVDGKAYDFDSNYKGEPKTAAKNAFRVICRKMGMNKNSCKVKFVLREITNGSKKKEYHYEGYFEKLDKPIKREFGGIKHVMTHKKVVKKLK